jgi:NAD(P)-dependent dehydrogenase (short-subunit alcohol dehydrogenase family)
LTGQRAVVTGASSGVGRAIAIALAREGATVMLVGRDPARLEAATAEAGNGAVAQRADLTRDEDLRALAERALEDLGGIDILVHAAAIIELGPVEEGQMDDFDRLYQTNLRAPYALTKALLGSLCMRGGQVVFVNSSAARNGGAANAAQYAATKGGFAALADSLRAEVNEAGVRVLTLYLGRTATPMQTTVLESEGRICTPDALIQSEDAAEMVVGALSLPRTAEVTEIAMRPMRKLDSLKGLALAYPGMQELLASLPFAA